MEKIMCDFCSSYNVEWKYEALSSDIAQIGLLRLSTIGGWAACDVCSSLIEAKDKDGLVKRSVDTQKDEFSLGCEMIEIFVREIHKAFWLCKHGERIFVGDKKES